VELATLAARADHGSAERALANATAGSYVTSAIGA
jgi:hypothetical protein